MSHRPERDAFVNFTQIYLPTPLVIMRRTGDDTIRSEADLGGQTVALVKEYSSSKKVMEEHPNVKPLTVRTVSEGLFAVATRNADAYVGVLGINLYLARKNGITGLEVASLYGSGTNGQRFGIRKDWPELATILDKALKTMPESDKNTIFDGWLSPESSKPLYQKESTNLALTINKLRLYDEILTQSVRSYAYSQETKWKNRYRKTQPKLDNVISKIRSSYLVVDRPEFQRFNEANNNLYALEAAIISLVDKGDDKSAIRILEGDDYHKNKAVYTDLLDKKLGLKHTHRKSDLILSDEEREWLKKHPKLIFSVPTKAPPLYFLNDQAELAGINIDYMRLLANRVGITIEFKGYSTWSGALESAKKHLVDGIPNADATEDRKAYLNFTDPYSTFPQVIVTRKDYDLIRRIEDVSGKRIAVKKSSSRICLLKNQYPKSEIIEVNTIQEGLDLLVGNKVDALYANLVQVDAILADTFYPNLKYAVVAETPPVGLARIGLRNDDPMLLQIFNRAIASISRQEHLAIKENWLPIDKYTLRPQIELTAEERNWLNEHPVIRVMLNPYWAPVTFLSEQGDYQGISMDYLKHLEKLIGVRFEVAKGLSWSEGVAALRNKKLDMAASMADTNQRKDFTLFTRPYLSMPINPFF